MIQIHPLPSAGRRLATIAPAHRRVAVPASAVPSAAFCASRPLEST